MPLPIDPSFSVTSPEWSVDGLAAPGAGQAAPVAGGFGNLLGGALQSLTTSQTDAASAAQQLASGQATDPTAVVMAVERAQLAMQLASQIRTKAVEAANDIFHTQV
jgi:flagellar hook-basal body complex protein FliE